MKALKDQRRGVLAWTLGDYYGGNIRSRKMVVCCFLVDFKIANGVMEEDLQTTNFGGYSGIYDQHPIGGRTPKQATKKCQANCLFTMCEGHRTSKALPRFGRALGSGDGTRTHDLGVMNPSL